MRRRQFISFLGGASLAPLTASRVHADPPDGCGVSLARDDGWPVASVNDDKLIDREALCSMADRLSRTGNVHAVLIARGGKLVFERYFKGSDEIPGRIYGRRVGNVTFDADTLHDMKSVSKSVASLALGIAIDRGLIPASTNRSLAFSQSCRTCVPLKRNASSCCTRSPCRWVCSGRRRRRPMKATTTRSACIGSGIRALRPRSCGDDPGRTRVTTACELFKCNPAFSGTSCGEFLPRAELEAPPYGHDSRFGGRSIA